MTVITLTADELARWERGERTWIEPGEEWWPDSDTLTECGPPVRWRDAVGPCPTCGGMPNVLTHRSVVDAYGRIKCPDCRGTGKLLTELHRWLDISEIPGWALNDGCSEGTLLVATVSVEVLRAARNHFAIVFTEVPT